MSVDAKTYVANREVCDIDIVKYADGTPFMHYEYANTTGLNITSDNVYAMGHGARRVAFNGQLEGSLSVEFQVAPLQLLSLYSDGTIDSDATYFVKTEVKCATAGTLPLAVSAGTVSDVFVYASGDYGGTAIAGTFASGTFTATTAADLTVDSTYEVGFLVKRTSGVHTLTLNNKKLPPFVTLYMSTLDKDEEGNLVPKRIIIHKALIQRNLDMSYSSEGDPQSLTMTFDLMTDDDDSFIEIVELENEISVNPSQS